MENQISSYLLINTENEDVLEDAYWLDADRITKLINKDLPQITIKNVMKVNNPYTAAMYDLKKKEYQSRTGANPLQELELFHCTSEDDVDNIVEDNLNWRFVTRAKYGIGNSFSSDADYANCHANRRNGEDRAFIICKVLVRDQTEGSYDLETLPDGYDTAVGGPNDEVYVKFNDNEFLPQFVAYYTCLDSYIRNSKFY